MGKDVLKIRKLENRLERLVQEIYEAETSRVFTPRYPWLLVRVLPKINEKLGRILLPQTQNKIMYEGIVLAVWKPFWIHKEKRFKSADGIMGETGWAETRTLRKSEFRVGQRIGFPHFEGLPIRHLDENNYRIVREEVDLNQNPNCGVFGWVGYDGDGKLQEEMERLLSGVSTVTLSGE